ncbi:MAG TPA: undecaprenyl-diphosphate phosphatase [Gaiellales bacterium]
MNTTHAIVLGFVQGITEFLPVSSTGHLRIVPAFLGWEDPGAAFTAVTQLGTMAAILVFFRADISRIVVAWVRGLRDPVVRQTLDSRIGWYVAVGTIPIGILGFAFRNQVETGARNLQLIGAALIALGLVLLYAEHVATRSRGIESLTMRDGILIGIAQACALIPGVSRSGATITGGLFLGLDRTSAARYSFLLSIPAVVLSGLLELRHATEGNGPGAGATIIATVIAFVVGYASIAFLLRFLTTHSTRVFVVYRVVVGAIVLVLATTGTIS